MIDPFEMHEIDHLSPSQLIQFRRDPAHYIVERLIVRPKFTANPFTARGQAVEHALSEKLFDPKREDDDIIKGALIKYQKDLKLKKFKDKESQAKLIQPMFENSYEQLKDYGIPTRPNQFQHKITLDIGKEFPEVIGYLDFWWQQHNIILDLKTSTTMSKKIKLDHQWQGSVYAAAKEGNEVRFCYATGKLSTVYALNKKQIKNSLQEVVWTANQLKKVLAVSKDPQEIVNQLPIIPNYYSSYGTLNYWWSDELRERSREIFGV